jgi:hypothetical protein
MKIEMTERELNNICNNVIKQVARFVDKYMEEAEESEHEKDIYMVETAHLIEEILSIDVDLKTITQPKN